jgi:hypothetical protein
LQWSAAGGFRKVEGPRSRRVADGAFAAPACSLCVGSCQALVQSMARRCRIAMVVAGARMFPYRPTGFAPKQCPLDGDYLLGRGVSPDGRFASLVAGAGFDGKDPGMAAVPCLDQTVARPVPGKRGPRGGVTGHPTGKEFCVRRRAERYERLAITGGAPLVGCETRGWPPTLSWGFGRLHC